MADNDQAVAKKNHKQPEEVQEDQKQPEVEVSAEAESKPQPETKTEQALPTGEQAEAKTEVPPKAEKKKDVTVPKEFKDLIDKLDKLTAPEISKFVQFLEEYWGVSAAAQAVAVSSAPSGGTEVAPAAEQKSEYDVLLKDPGAQKVAVIKAVKDVTGLGLGEAKAIVDSAPKVVKEKVAKDEAEEAKKALEAAGATVEIS